MSIHIKIGGLKTMIKKGKKGMGLLILASMVLVGCGTTTNPGNGESSTDTSVDQQLTEQESERIEAFVLQEELKTDEDKLNEFRGQLEALSKFYQGGFNYQFYTIASQDGEIDESLKLMYETYGTKVGDKYYVPVSQKNLVYDGERVQIEDKSLPQGNIYVMSKHVYDGVYVYEEVDRLLTFAKGMVEENSLVDDIRELLFTEGLEERLTRFESKYQGYWLRSETDIYTQPIDSIREYFGELHSLSNDDNTVIDEQNKVIKMTLTPEQVASLNDKQTATYPIFYETYTQEGEEELVYELHYNYENKTFTTHRIAPEGSTLNSYFAEIFPIGFDGQVEVPSEQDTLIETDTFYEEYIAMLGIKEDYLQQELEEEPEGDTVAEEPEQVTGD